MQNLAGVRLHRVHNDASVSPASLELVLVLGLFRIEGLVEESPGQLFLPVNLQSPACSHANELPPKVGVFFIVVIQSDRQQDVSGNSVIYLSYRSKMSLCV